MHRNSRVAKRSNDVRNLLNPKTMKTSRTFRASSPRSSRLGAATLLSLARLFCVFCLLTATASAQRELHVVGFYEGTDGSTHGAVLVNRPGQSVTLFLSAYDTINWEITVAAGTTLERVFLNGYHLQGVQGVPAGVPVFKNGYEENGRYFRVGYTMGSSSMLRAVPEIYAITGQEISSFQGSYQAPANPLVIDAVQDDPRLSVSYPQPVPLSQLPDLNFQIFTYEPGRVTTHPYTLAGPVNGGPLIPDSFRVSPDAAGRTYYGGTDGMIGFDTLTGVTQSFPLPEHIQREGWQMGTTFDRARNRGLMVTLAGEGFVYALNPQTGQWSTAFSVHNRDFDCLEYHGPDDLAYGVTLAYGDDYRSRLIGLKPSDGTVGKDIELPVLPFNISPSQHRAELVSVGEYLVLLLEPQNWRYPYYDGLLERRIYLIDPRSGEIWLTHRNTGPPNQPPHVNLIAPADGSTVAPGSTIRLTASASDQDGSIASVEFRVDGHIVGFGTRGSNGLYVLDWKAPDNGQFEVTATAKDNRGAEANTLPARVRINSPPSVEITSPANGSSFARLTVIHLIATAEDSDGTISSVQFIVDGVSIGNGVPIPGTKQFSLLWTARDPGSRVITARAVDNFGASTLSESIAITVTGDASKAMRLLPAQYQAGKKFRVGILVTPGRETTSYSVIERPPAGWTVSGISHGGTYDAASGEVRFGPIESDRVRLLTYSVKPPSKAKGVQIFSGEIVADGVSTQIGGQQTIGGPRVNRQTLRGLSLQ
jgi:hypothetical protein